MKLYYSSASPFVRKVLVSAMERGLDGRITHVPTKVLPTEPNRDLGKSNPLMKLPTLELDDGSVLFESILICEYLDTLPGGPRLFPEGDRRWRALRVHAMADGILDAAVLTRYETAVRPAELRWDAWVQGQMTKVDQSLDFLEKEAPRFESLDIGSIATGCALGYLDFRFGDRKWRDGRPQLARWFETVSRRPSFEKTVPKA